VSQAKGKRAPAWVADYLRPWFPLAEAAPTSRQGRDLLNTPGMVFEVKTGAEWRPNAWRAQVDSYAARDGTELAVVTYLPPGLGERQVGDAMTLLPLRLLMPLAVAEGYAPAPQPREVR
jgi:hypothetical protein